MATKNEFDYILRLQLRETRDVIALLEKGDVEAAMERLKKTEEILEESLREG
ncbi:MAG: hypothetical protein IJ679_05595 [Lachnospiraceae bacterium]|nr:hypothetical protein [Lachnospiraceae bacterium]